MNTILVFFAFDRGGGKTNKQNMKTRGKTEERRVFDLNEMQTIMYCIVKVKEVQYVGLELLHIARKSRTNHLPVINSNGFTGLQMSASNLKYILLCAASSKQVVSFCSFYGASAYRQIIV